jgi:hypothetical protein
VRCFYERINKIDIAAIITEKLMIEKAIIFCNCFLEYKAKMVRMAADSMSEKNTKLI